MNKVAEKLRVGCEEFSLSCGSKLLCMRTAVEDQNIVDCSRISMTRLSEPSKYDVVQECDGCGQRRFCHYGYAWAPHTDSYEAVVAMCEPCGGIHVDVDALSDEDEDEDEALEVELGAGEAGAGAQAGVEL